MDLFDYKEVETSGAQRQILHLWTPGNRWQVKLQLVKSKGPVTTSSRSFSSKDQAILWAAKWHKKYGNLPECFDDSWVARSIVEDVAAHTDATFGKSTE